MGGVQIFKSQVLKALPLEMEGRIAVEQSDKYAGATLPFQRSHSWLTPNPYRLTDATARGIGAILD